MKLSRNWIEDFVSLEGLSDEDLARLLTEIGHAVESIETHDGETVFDIEFTTNRVDAMSHRGVARELGAALGRDLTVLDVPRNPPVSEGTEFSVAIDAPEMCSRYSAFLIRGVRVGTSSERVRKRLESVGLRPINNIVDVTNYLMLALGHPLHAFDFDRIRGRRIIVRPGRAGETITSLDGMERAIDQETVVIADGERGVGLGGVIGGANSEIGETTRDVLLECAHFSPGVIRRTARRLGIRTDASYRFERGVDPADTVEVIRQAAEMIRIEAGGEPVEIVDVVAREPAPPRITLRTSRLEMFSAGAAGPGFALDLFRRLGMDAAPTGEGIEITVPTWRGDLGEETDLIEEVLRFHGYDRIPAALPRLTTGDVRHIPLQDLEESVRDLLSGCGLTELITYSFIHPEVNELFSREAPANIGNALTENLASMRLSLLPGLLEAVHHNLSYGTRDGGVFEVGRRYPLEEGGIVERSTAAFVLFGQAAPHWSDPRRAADYFDAKGIVETIAARFHVALEVRAAEPPWGLEGQSAEAIAGERVVARLGTVSREVLRKMGVKANVIAGEIDLEALLASTGGWQMEEVSRHPGVPMVLPLLHDRNLDYGTIIAQVERADVPWLKEVGLWDRYTPEGSDQIKTTLAMWYQALDRSLTQEEVADTHQRLTRILTEALPVRVAE